MTTIEIVSLIISAPFIVGVLLFSFNYSLNRGYRRR